MGHPQIQWLAHPARGSGNFQCAQMERSGVESAAQRLLPMLLQTTSTPTSAPLPLPFIALVLAILGAISDWRYRRNGGKRSSKKDTLLFLTALGLVVAFFIVLGLIGVGDVAGMIGAASVDFAIVLFATWELGRWRVRRKNPLEKRTIGPAEPLCPGCGRGIGPQAKFCSHCGRAI